MIHTEYPRPNYVFAHISDTHLPADHAPLYGAADADGHLAAMLEAIEASGARLHALLFTGDLADRGDASAYRRLREAVEPVAERIGAEILWAPGNHDDRAALRADLLGENGAGAREPVCYVRWFGGLRVVSLDSTVPGAHWGALDEGRLEWLAGVLEKPAPEGTLLLMHHAPLPTVLDLAVTVELRDQAELAAVLRGSDVRAILSGHIHHPSFGTFAGIPVAVASSTAYGQDLTVAAGGTRGQNAAQGWNLVQVYDDTVVHSVVALQTGNSVGEFVPPAEASRRIAAQGIRWRHPGASEASSLTEG
jgi:Icc protein